jgi:ABC-type polysaccharide/polyol phosphate export permease
MLRKHWLLKKKMKGQLLWELLTPCMMGLLLQYMSKAFAENAGLAATMMPFFMVFYTPYITLMPSRFIIQSMVEDKATKMRETLRLMSLSRTSYAMSFFIVQSIFAVLNGAVIGYMIFDNEIIFPEHERRSRSIQYTILSVLMCLGYIGFSMSLSTFFSDPKVAQ